ncbi:hypothetical protein HYH03_017425 [Edaphochlamys debaryana]|uniref:G domain-containing protein n=1 Tax=Edaphochlamys debaryana TaxID=47281 RepID=A0A835XH80_9CHLO|nr:hypothetical protein HYH03_017425 [Edaphochlamys debaryana]|eukprot:KAG2483706.1 hypothetical protein HYH03_017425 [Edaphochlamys debaryana]
MQALALCAGQATVLRPIGCTQASQASTSPRCAKSARPTATAGLLCGRPRSQLRGATLPQLVIAVPRRCAASAAAGSQLTPLADDDLDYGMDPMDDTDVGAEADVEPGLVDEMGGRSYLELTDMNDESLQVRMVQWYPGHIARAERQLKAQLGMVDVVIEVRDARIPVSTAHPQVPLWVGTKPRLLVVNRADEVAPGDVAAWRRAYREGGVQAFWTDGRAGEGVAGVKKALLKVSVTLNEKRARRGLQPRAVRAVVIGFPNIGKSALINRLLGRRAVASAPKPGVTRSLRWVRLGGELDLLDAPGVIPAAFRDQLAAQRLAMCNDIGEAAYLPSAVGAALVARIKQLAAREAAEAEAEAAEAAAQAAEARQAAAEAGQQPGDEPGPAPGPAEASGRSKRGGGGGGGGSNRRGRGGQRGGGGSRSGAPTGTAPAGGGRVMAGVVAAMEKRYGLNPLAGGTAEDYVVALADARYGGDPERAGQRLLSDFRSGVLGRFALERPGDAVGAARRAAGLAAAAEKRERGRQSAEEHAGSGGGGYGAPAGGYYGGAGSGAEGSAASGEESGWAGGVGWSTGRGAAEAGGAEAGFEVNSRWVEEAEAAARAAEAEAERGRAQAGPAGP